MEAAALRGHSPQPFAQLGESSRGASTWLLAGGPSRSPASLHRRSHNNLRITRILKSLGELGLEHYQAPLARFFLEETLVRGELPGVRQSALDYFLFAVRCRRQRRELVHFAWEHFQPRREFVWGPRDKLQRFKPQATLQPLVAPRQAEGHEGPGDPLQEAGAQDQTCGQGRDPSGDGASAEVPQPRSVEQQDTGALEGDPGGEAGPPSPKESKKRKLEAHRREQAAGEPGPQGPSDVEKIALNLEGCALSQGSQDLGEPEQPCPQPPGARVADEVRKRRKVEEGAGNKAAGSSSTQVPAPAPSQSVRAQEGGSEVEEEPESQVGPEQSACGSPSESPEPGSAGTSVDGVGAAAGTGPSASPSNGKP